MTDKIILDAKAWQEGFAAGRRGLKWNANPYPAGTDASRSWQSGRGRRRRSVVRPALACLPASR